MRVSLLGLDEKDEPIRVIASLNLIERNGALTIQLKRHLISVLMSEHSFAYWSNFSENLPGI